MAKELAKSYNPSEFEDRIYDFWLKGNYFHAEVDKDKKPYTGTFDCTLTTKDGIVLLEGYPTGTSGTVKSNMPVATHSREISYPTLRQAANIATQASRK